MNLFDKEEKRKGISCDFKKIEEQIFDLMQAYHSDQSCNVIKLTNELIIYEKNIIDKRGKNKNRIEENILIWIRILYSELITGYEFDYVYLEESVIANTKDKELRQAHSVSFEILKLVQLIIDFNMPKDNFASKRKGHAIGLFCILLTKYNIKGEFDILKKVLDTGKDALLIRTLEELDSFTKITEKELPKDIIQTLYNLIKKTKNRSLAVGCLNVLISIGKESEGSALKIIDDWKETNYDYS